MKKKVEMTWKLGNSYIPIVLCCILGLILLIVCQTDLKTIYGSTLAPAAASSSYFLRVPDPKHFKLCHVLRTSSKTFDTKRTFSVRFP